MTPELIAVILDGSVAQRLQGDDNDLLSGRLLVLSQGLGQALPLARRKQAGFIDDAAGERGKSNAGCAAAICANASSATTTRLNQACRRCSTPISLRIGQGSELHRRCHLCVLGDGEGLHRLVARIQRHRPQAPGECPQLRIILPHRLDVVAAGDGDPVLGAFQL